MNKNFKLKTLLRETALAFLLVSTISAALGAIDYLINPEFMLQECFGQIAVPVTICFFALRYYKKMPQVKENTEI